MRRNELVIRLRKVRKSDLGYFLKWWKDKELIKLTSGVYEKSNKVLEEYFYKMLALKKNYHFIILCQEKPIGNISLTHLNQKTFEIHVVIGEKKYWGRGLGIVTIKKVLRFAFMRLNYKKAYLEVRESNARAIRAYSNCGFSIIGSRMISKEKTILLKMTLSRDDFLNNMEQHEKKHKKRKY